MERRESASIEQKVDATATTAPGGAQAFRAFEQTVGALQDVSVLKAGGVTAYAVYAVALVLALSLVLSIFAESLVGILTTLIWASVLTAIAGIGANLATGYIRFKTHDAAARHEFEALRLRAQVASARNTAVVKLLGTWSSQDARAFERTVGDHPDLLLKLADSFDQVGVRLGLEPEEAVVGFLGGSIGTAGDTAKAAGASSPAGAAIPAATTGGRPSPQA